MSLKAFRVVRKPVGGGAVVAEGSIVERAVDVGCGVLWEVGLAVVVGSVYWRAAPVWASRPLLFDSLPAGYGFYGSQREGLPLTP